MATLKGLARFWRLKETYRSPSRESRFDGPSAGDRPIALSGFDDALGLRAPIGGKRAADVVALLKFAFRVPTNIPFVAFVRLYQFTSRSHWFLL